ncbi:MAG TPA: SgcJ/EcaC family oxidoreductase [Lacipirellulaceae bacterium]|nr:SgcJ/EcaC family oxidoreductase [Lacipirellulaceae bacterium]
MSAKRIVAIALWALLAGGVAVARADQAADESAIRSNVDKYVEAYNRRDSKTMASMWSPEAVYMDPTTGEGVVGRDAIAKQFDYTFAGSEDAKLAVTVDSIEFVSPNVVVEKGTAEVTYSEFEPEKTAYTAVHVKRDGQWLIDRVSEEEVQPPPPSNYENLKELEWLVGTWIDQDEQATIKHECNWTKNQNFLTRSFAVVIGDQIDMSGMQIIGWDPAAKQIRSWVFDSDGAFGEGKWTRKGNRWLIQQVGTLPDGRKTSAVNIMTQIDNDSYTWQSVSREVDGEVLPNIEEVQIVRESPGLAGVVISVDTGEPGDAASPADATEPADAAEPAAAAESADAPQSTGSSSQQ